MYFSEDQSQALNSRIRALEKNTGVELVAAVVDKCDHYPEIPWKAFALGAAAGALMMLIQVLMRPDWISADAALTPLLTILGVGTLAALLTVVWSGWARCFLDNTRAEGEMRQYAQSLFLEHEVFKVPDRCGILVVIGLFEHQVVILPDRGVKSRLSADALANVIAAMLPPLKQGNRLQALTEGLARLEAHLKAAGFAPQGNGTDRIPEALLQQKGGADA
jgi:putative membrane protein